MHSCASKRLSEWTESCLLRQGSYEVIYITYITLGVKSTFIHNNFCYLFCYLSIRTIQDEIQEEFRCSSRHWSGISEKKYRYNLAIQFYHLDSRVLLPRHPDPSFELSNNSNSMLHLLLKAPASSRMFRTYCTWTMLLWYRGTENACSFGSAAGVKVLYYLLFF